jgi:uncharacterized protein YrrD
MLTKLKNIEEEKLASELKGLIVLSLEEGKLLGKVSKVFVDKEDAALSGIMIKDQFWSMGHQYISVKEIQSLGEDVIYVKSKKSLSTPNNAKQDISLKDLQGHWVTTHNGRHLGQFEDAMFTTTNWKVTEVMMSEDKRLAIQLGDITFGTDEILVPAEYSSKVQSSKVKKLSLLSRVFADEPSTEKFKTQKKTMTNKKKAKTLIDHRVSHQKKSKSQKKNQIHAQ